MVQVIPDEDTFEKEILNNGRVIREAFERSDIEMIRALHHPEVVKALGDNDIKNGREEVIDTLKGTLGKFYLFFLQFLGQSWEYAIFWGCLIIYQNDSI